MSEYDYKCMTCGEEFDADSAYCGVPFPPDKCPHCWNNNYISTEQYEENTRINLRDEELEDRRLFSRQSQQDLPD
jgi:DNA-directed RNA polymerase subunit RPC12/RpoP